MTSMETSVIRKIGTSCGLILNSRVLFCVGLKQGDKVGITCEDGKIVICKIE